MSGRTTGVTALKAMVFDMDGTLADSDPFHRRAFAELLKPHGMTMDEEFYRTKISGRTNAAIFEELFPLRSREDHDRFADDKEATFRRIAADLAPLDGLLDVLDWAEARALRLGLVTNAPRPNVDHILSALRIEGRFQVLIAGGDVERAKPDPLPYLTAIEHLGVDAHEAIAFEDSVSGVKAAKAAGLLTIGVLTGQLAETLREAGADEVIRDFRDPALRCVLEAGRPQRGPRP